MSRAADLRKALYADRSEAIVAASPPTETEEPEPDEETETPPKRKPGRPRKATK